MNTQIGIVLVAGLLIGSCGGGGSDSSSRILDDVSGSSNFISYNACNSSYYRDIVGEYQGFTDIQIGEDDNNTTCVFDVTLTIVGTPMTASGLLSGDRADVCELSGQFSSTASQISTIDNSDGGVGAECVDTQSTGLSFNDPNNSVIDPEIFYENIVYPVSVGVLSPLTIIDTEPTQGFPNLISINYGLFTIPRRVVEFIEFNGNNSISFQSQGFNILQSNLSKTRGLRR